MHYLMLRRRAPELDGLAALAAREPGEDAFYLEHPAHGRLRLGLGRLAARKASGANRFLDSAEAARELLSRVEVRGDTGPGAPEPLLLGGFAFADRHGAGAWRGFPSAEWLLPERLLVREAGSTWLAALAPLSAAGADPCAALDERIADWRRRAERGRAPETLDLPLTHRVAADQAPAAFVARVGDALDAIAAGELEKVVLARSVHVTRAGGFDALELLAELRERLPSSASFLVARGDARFLGATPERLLRRAGRRVESVALAGTAPRGRSPDEDSRLARALVESKKEQAEHAVVLRFLRERLALHADTTESPESPELLRLEGLQHLRSPITARLGADVPLLSLAQDLHPTPATCGAPLAPARRWLAAHEGMDRGWYAGPLGWTDATGDGELWVALRCGLLRGDDARLFAGAGVVAGSDPGAELRETRLKLSALLSRVLEV